MRTLATPSAVAAALALALAALGPSARAGTGAEGRPASISPHITTGFEILGNSDVSTTAWRSYLGMDLALGHGGLRPIIGIGSTLALGSFELPDARALNDTLSLTYLEVGPALRLGLRWGDGGIVDTHLFASFAYLRTNIDKRLGNDRADVTPDRWGMRAALGANWAEQIGRVAGRPTKGSDDGSWLIVILPHQAELVWERSYGSDRYGVTISYGI